MTDEGPDAGHTWEFTAVSRMSSRVVGQRHHRDAKDFGPAITVRVRAWNLQEALRKAAELPLTAWSGWGDD